jgi:hypothetical protein
MSKNNKEEILKRMFSSQKSFSELFFNHENLTQEERENLSIHFAASLNKEVSSLLDGVNYRQHRLKDVPPNISKIMHESVDVFRYLIAIMNIWGIDAEDFIDAFDIRDKFLNARHESESLVWDHQPVLIVDIDDVLTPFRRNCTTWVKKYHDENVDEASKAYYHISEELFHKFIDARQMKDLDVNEDIVNAINHLYDQGYWIQLLTARPGDNLTCKYDTYSWLEKAGIKYHRLSFSPEKYLWVSCSDYYKKGQVICAIDDSPKHAAEYAKHDLLCLAPRTGHNTELESVKGVKMYDTGVELIDLIEKATN